jgi:GT2 family glycosyltransferase
MRAERTRPHTTSVVICCYTMERWDDLRAGVVEVLRQSTPDVETVVCVDHNPELSQRARSELGGVRVIDNTKEPGLSGARNCGVEETRGEVVVFLDDDAVPGPGWLAALTAPFADPRVKAVGGAAEPSWPLQRPSWFPREFDWVVGCSYLGLPERRQRVRNVMGCNMAIHRSVFEAGIEFQSGVGRGATNVDGGEETELCIRVQQRWPDAQILFEPSAVVAHRVSDQRTSWRYFARRCYAEGRSKARVSGYVGAGDALSTEWAYTRRVLPQGVRAGVREAVTGHVDGLARSATIVLGLGITSAGYLRGRYVS